MNKYETKALLEQYLELHYKQTFLKECVQLLDKKGYSALDLGCAVGGACFELSKFCQQVIGVDNSKLFIKTASKMHPEITFICQDAMKYRPKMPFDIVLVLNLLCRLKNPKSFLERLPTFMAPGGQLILSTPYSWQEAYTPKENWLTEKKLKQLLQKNFRLEYVTDIPFSLQVHKRLFEWCIPEVSRWIRK